MDKVICNKANTCKEKPYCGAAKPHSDSSCEPCPFNDNAKCVDYQEPIGVAVKLKFEEDEDGVFRCPSCKSSDLEQFGDCGFECNECGQRISDNL